MNKLDIAGSKLSVQRVPQSSASLLLKPVTNIAPVMPTTSAVLKSTVLKLSNMVASSDLEDDELYMELLEDVADECNKHGKVKQIVIPRGEKGSGLHGDIGKIFVNFTDITGAEKAFRAISGRRFNGTTVEAEFFPELDFNHKVSIMSNIIFSSIS